MNIEQAAEAIVGQTILKVELEADTIYIRTPAGTLSIMDDGQLCCEQRFITTDDDLALKGGIVRELVLEPVVGVDSDESGVHAVAFLRLVTSLGVAVFCTHNIHNGCYEGFNVQAEWHA